MTQPNDPSAFFRDMFGQMFKPEGLAQTMGGASGAAASAQAGLTQVMQRAFAAANMPSRAELEDLSARIGRIEASLFRIESILAEDRAASAAVTRKPAEPSDE